METRPFPWRRSLGLVFGLALLLRAAFLAEATRLDLFWLPVIDAEAYDRWAQELNRSGWLGRGVFYQDPLYPYLLGLLYKVVGRHLLLVAALQALLDAAGAVLVAVVGRRLFSARVGLVAGLLAACYPVSIFYVAVFEKTAVSGFFVLAAVVALLRVPERPTPPRALAAGVLLGAALLLRANVLLFTPAAALWLWSETIRLGRARAAGLVGALAAGAALMVAPVAARNWAVSGDLVLTTAQGGWNFYVGNSPESTGWLAEPQGVRTVPRFEQTENHRRAEEAVGRKLKPSEASRYWFRLALGHIGQEPRRYAGMLARKAFLLANDFEILDGYDFYFYREHSRVLKSLPLGWGLAFPLGLAGVALALARRDLAGPKALVLAFLAVYAASVLLFYVVGRYRMPLAPLLLVFAASALAWLWDALKAREFRRAAALALVAVPLGALSHRRFGEPNLDGSWFLTATALLEARRPAEALPIFERLRGGNPGRADLEFNRALALYRVGRLDEAVLGFREALLLDPKQPNLYVMLPQLYREKGEGLRADLFAALGQVVAGKADEGFAAIEALSQRAPDDKALLEVLDQTAFVAFQTGQVAAAVASWEMALSVAPKNPDLLLNLFVIHEGPDPAKALGYLARYFKIAAGDPRQEPKFPELRLREARLKERRSAGPRPDPRGAPR